MLDERGLDLRRVGIDSDRETVQDSLVVGPISWVTGSGQFPLAHDPDPDPAARIPRSATRTGLAAPLAGLTIGLLLGGQLPLRVAPAEGQIRGSDRTSHRSSPFSLIIRPCAEE